MSTELEKLSMEDLRNLPEAELERIASEHAFSVPWQYDTATTTYREDADGVPPSTTSDKDDASLTRVVLQALSWMKFLRNPHVNTSVRGTIGRLTGYGFEVSSDIQEIQDAIEEIELDPRNRLYNYWPKYVGRSFIEGELFICFTCHKDGFIEVDFIDPAVIPPFGDNEAGIIFHPTKTTMPLIYCIKDDDNDIDEHIPSIFIARYPELLKVAEKDKGYDSDRLNNSRNSGRKFRSLGGFHRFIVAWDKTFITRRNTGHVRTVLEWLTRYEDLKKYEMDHKKSAGAYVWNLQIEDRMSWIEWLKLSNEEREKTAIAAPKTPGGTLVSGPGMKWQAINPNLPNISDSDTDILHMVTSGLNEPEDVTTGRATSPFASVKASRGPMSDRTSDEVEYFRRFLVYDFWSNIFFLKSEINNFPKFFTSREAITFKSGEPVFANLKKKPETLIDVVFPTSQVDEMEARSRAMLGVKHGSLYETAGVPFSEILKRLGFGNLRKLRLKYETEKDRYPELIAALDAESVQEKKEAEPPRPKKNKLADDFFQFKDMTEKDWIQAWKKDPHWAKSLDPSPLAKRLVQEDKENSTKGDILEIGCGNGRDSIYFGKQGHNVTGIDISPDAVRIAKKNNKLNNVQFETGNAERLQFEDNQFDAIYSLSVLHSTNLTKSIKELSRVLKEEGLGLLYLYIKTIYIDPDDEKEKRTEINFKVGELEKTFSKNKLKVIDKYRDEDKDEDENGKHIHSIIVYFVRKK